MNKNEHCRDSQISFSLFLILGFIFISISGIWFYTDNKRIEKLSQQNTNCENICQEYKVLYCDTDKAICARSDNNAVVKFFNK